MASPLPPRWPLDVRTGDWDRPGTPFVVPKSNPCFVGFYQGPMMGWGPPTVNKHGHEMSCSHAFQGAYAIADNGCIYALAISYRPQDDPAKRYWVKIEAEVVDSP